MKILRVKINGLITKEQKESIETDIKRSILEGFVVHDSTVEMDVLEFDEIEDRS